MGDTDPCVAHRANGDVEFVRCGDSGELWRENKNNLFKEKFKFFFFFCLHSLFLVGFGKNK